MGGCGSPGPSSTFSLRNVGPCQASGTMAGEGLQTGVWGHLQNRGAPVHKRRSSDGVRHWTSGKLFAFFCTSTEQNKTQQTKHREILSKIYNITYEWCGHNATLLPMFGAIQGLCRGMKKRKTWPCLPLATSPRAGLPLQKDKAKGRLAHN